MDSVMEKIARPPALCLNEEQIQVMDVEYLLILARSRVHLRYVIPSSNFCCRQCTIGERKIDPCATQVMNNGFEEQVQGLCRSHGALIDAGMELLVERDG